MASLVNSVIDLKGKRVAVTQVGSWKHFRLARDGDGVAWLLFDRAGASANTLSAEVLEELDNVLNVVESDRPAALVIRSATPRVKRHP